MMPKHLLLLVALLAGCSLALQAAHADTSPYANPPEKGKQAWFLGMLKALADTPDLDNADKVGNILGVKFKKNVVTTNPSHMESFAKTFERDEYTPDSRTWFVAGPAGYASTGNFKPNGGNGYVAGVDPRAEGNAVNFKYFQSKRFNLDDGGMVFNYVQVMDDSQTTVIFYGIDKLTCIGLDDIKAVFPGIHHMGATDASSERYMYYPPVGEESGNVLSFEAPEGKCVTEATVHDFSGFGKRVKRATIKLEHCLEDAGDAFCSKHPDASPRDFALYDQLKVHLHQACGNLNSFYQKEPLTNQEPSEELDYGALPSSCPYHKPAKAGMKPQAGSGTP